MCCWRVHQRRRTPNTTHPSTSPTRPHLQASESCRQVTSRPYRNEAGACCCPNKFLPIFKVRHNHGVVLVCQQAAGGYGNVAFVAAALCGICVCMQEEEGGGGEMMVVQPIAAAGERRRRCGDSGADAAAVQESAAAVAAQLAAGQGGIFASTSCKPPTQPTSAALKTG